MHGPIAVFLAASALALISANPADAGQPNWASEIRRQVTGSFRQSRCAIIPVMNDWLELVQALNKTMTAHAPGWTDHNDSDPGITTLELMAYLAEGPRSRGHECIIQEPVALVADEARNRHPMLAGILREHDTVTLLVGSIQAHRPA